MAELVRVLHTLTTSEAQSIVESLAERRIPLIRQSGDLKRVLDPSVSFSDQVLVLIASSTGSVGTEELLEWIECKDRAYFKRLLRKLDIETDRANLAHGRLPSSGSFRRKHPNNKHFDAAEWAPSTASDSVFQRCSLRDCSSCRMQEDGSPGLSGLTAFLRWFVLHAGLMMRHAWRSSPRTSGTVACRLEYRCWPEDDQAKSLFNSSLRASLPARLAVAVVSK
jgi:hypothetical protein